MPSSRQKPAITLGQLQQQLEELRRTQTRLTQRYQLLEQAGNDGLWDWEAQTGDLYRSPVWFRTLGFEPDGLPPEFESWRERLHPEDVDRVLEAFNRHLRGETEEFRAEYRIRNRNDEYQVVMDRGRAHRDETGQVVRVVGSLTDVTERLRNEQRAVESEHRLRVFLNTLSEGILVVDKNLHFVDANPAFYRLVGRDETKVRDETPHNTEMRLIHPDGSPFEPADFPSVRALQTGKPVKDVVQGVYDIEGKLRWALVNATPLFAEEDGSLNGAVLAFVDITAQIEREEELRLTSEVFVSSPEAIVLADHKGRVLRCNPAWIKATGFDVEQAYGKPMLSLYRISDQERQLVLERVQTTGAWSGEFEILNLPGQIHRVVISAAHNQHGTLTHFVSQASDITEQKRAEQRIEYLAYYDSVTGLPNRRLIRDRLSHALALARRDEGRLAVMMLDLDRFKLVNDTAGHQFGDKLLNAVGERLNLQLRDSDVLGRLGGDEFVVVLEDTGPRGVARVAERLLSAMAEPFVIEGQRINITPSIGTSVFPGDGDDEDELLKLADIAMYHAKREGRNRHHFYDSDVDTHTAQQLVLESALRTALEQDQLQLYLQPKIHHPGNLLVGAEALLRWQHPEMGFISPGHFIPIAEESGLIVDIGEWVLNRVCATLAHWREIGLEPCPVSINLSSKECQQSQLTDKIAEVLERYQLPGRWLEFELTEHSLMLNDRYTRDNLVALRKLGCRISLDDFGTGYSSLAYLKRLPLDCIKVDGSFVQELTMDPASKAIVKAIIELTRVLGKSVVAEGVETEQQADILAGLGCHCHQGYWHARPMPEADFKPLLSV